MPLIEAGFKNNNGTPDVNQLLIHGPTIWVNVGPYKMPENPQDLRVATQKLQSTLLQPHWHSWIA